MGVVVAVTVIGLWASLLTYNLVTHVVSWASPLTCLMVLVQAHLFTGLFITGHDAMHGLIAPANPRLNHFLGRLALSLFLFNSYDALLPKHGEHHRYAGTRRDPDFHRGNPGFFPWFFAFMKEYVSWKQIFLTALAFNLAQLIMPTENLVLFLVVAPILSLMQLFFFGTYRPHGGEHENPHHAGSQEKNHLWAFLSCYFFGYHLEHHERPDTPWWRLWLVKDAGADSPAF